MTDLIRVVTSVDGHAHPLDVPGYDASNPVTIPSSGDFDLLTVMAPETLHAMQDELSSLVASGVITTVQVITPEQLWNLDAGGTEIEEDYTGTHSHQSTSADLTLSAGAGSADGSNPKYLAASMWNLFGDTLTKDANYLGGSISAYSITGTKATTYPSGAVLAQITDGVTEADGAVVAYIDGDSSLTKAGAAFTVRNNNSTPGSGFHFGLDLKGAAHDGYPAVAYLDGEIRFANGTYVVVSGDTLVFHNAANTKSATITMS